MAILAALIAAGPALAQTSPLIVDQNRADRVPLPSAPAGMRVAQPAQTAVPMIAPFVLREVQVQNTSIDPMLIAEATRPFIGQTIDAGSLQKIADAVAGAYEHSDIGLYTITVPDQGFEGGVLRVVASENYLEGVDFSGDTDGDTSLVRSYGAKLTGERPLRRKTLQRYVSLIRDIPGLTPNLQLIQGSAPGANRLTVGLDQKRMQVGLGFNTNGSDALGRYQMQADATFYGLLRQGEQTRFSFATTPDFHRFQYFAFSETQPVGTEGTQAQFNAGLLRTHPKGTGIRGEAVTLQFLVNHPLIRLYDESLYVFGGLDGLNSENAVLGQNIANERVRTFRTGLSYSKTNPRNVFAASAAFSFGIDGLGARTQSPILAVTDFVKINGQLGYDQQLGRQWFVRLRGTGQYGADSLPSSELMGLGGGEFGRAFPAAAIVGDSGAAGSGEIAWRPEGLGPTLQGSELYAFADRERTWVRRRVVAGQDFDLASAGIGTRIAVGPKTLVQFEAANVLDAPAFVADDGDWRFNFAIKANY